MSLNRLTPVPPITPSSAEDTASSKDPELQKELEEWRQQMKALSEKENSEDEVTHRNTHWRTALVDKLTQQQFHRIATVLLNCTEMHGCRRKLSQDSTAEYPWTPISLTPPKP